MNKELQTGKRMNMWKTLPQLAWKGMVKNKTVYYPYLGAGIFSVFTYFVFSSILHNDIVEADDGVHRGADLNPIFVLYKQLFN